MSASSSSETADSTSARPSSRSSKRAAVNPVIEALKDGTSHAADNAMLNEVIVPRLVICSASDLIEPVFKMDCSRFDEMSQRARKSGKKVMCGQSEDAQEQLREQFKKVHDWHRAATGASTGDSTWIQGVARHVSTHNGGPDRHRSANLGGMKPERRPNFAGIHVPQAQTESTRQPRFKLLVAAAEGPARLYVHGNVETSTGKERRTSKDAKEVTQFLACDDVDSILKEFPWNRVTVQFAVSPSARTGEQWYAPELVKVVLDLVEHVLSRPTRLFAPGLAVIDDAAYLVVLDHETCRVATISDCWGQGFGELAAYKPTRGHTAVVLLTSVFGSLAGRTVKFEDEEPIELVSCATVDGGRPLSERCTTVFRLTRPSLSFSPTTSAPWSWSPSFVLKMQLVSPSFVRAESEVLRKINDAYDKGALLPAVFDHLAALEVAVSLSRPISSWPSMLTCNYQQHRLLQMAPQSTKSPEPRRWSAHARASHSAHPTPLPQPLVQRDPSQQKLPRAQIFQVFDQLLKVLTTLHGLAFYHRDLSFGNILHFEGHLVLIDWDGGVAAGPGASVAIAAEEHGRLRVTKRSAPRQALQWNLMGSCGQDVPQYKLAHVFELTAYCLLQVLAYRIRPEDRACNFFVLQSHRPSPGRPKWRRRRPSSIECVGQECA
ncbi:BQ2448_3000 [Microbotryum intermedium]|uniref:BQ2448_3000 protein n=1 Tax=Microbotryum intermedium TaxID=269621 RepID=A0A238FC41_9BASI|nr:BQ2448_3000 [Microbotryum intermedium]